jgi:deoxyadenosine/deoxycytidine kinase
MWIALEGIIGAGKTTTASLISRGSRYALLLEPSDEHPFLDDYYRDPASYVLETEIAFMLLQRHQVLQKAPKADRHWISDYAPAKNLVFAGLVASPAEMSFIETVDRELWSGLARPDLVIYLDVPVDVCKVRIDRRGRPYEAGIAASDLERLGDAYKRSLDHLGGVVRVLKLRGTETPAIVAEEVTGLITGLSRPR